MFDKTDIIITTSTQKKELLHQFTNSLTNIKIYTLSEFNKLFYYDYEESTILYIMNKYNVIYEIAKIYLNNLTYITDQTYKSPKLQFLQELKKDLIENKLLIINKLFKHSLTNKNITIYNLGETKEITRLKEDLASSNVTIINNQELKYKSHSIYELNTIEDEVAFVANDICSKVSSGVDIKNIYLVNLGDEYYKLIKRIFPMFNLPFTLKPNESIYGTFLVNKFLELYEEDMSKVLTELHEYVNNEDTEDIYNQILDIVNNYAFIDNYLDVLPLIKNDLKNTKLQRKNIINSVHESSLDDSYTEEDYVYLLSFNQGVIPHIHKDELYLSDIDREELNISLTVDKNIEEKNKTIQELSNIKNLIITYKTRKGDTEYQVSSINDVLNYPKVDDTKKEYSYSNLYNKIVLANLKDEFYKYGTTSDTLFTLDSTYKDLPYNTFDNKYRTISKESLKEKLNGSLNLSYTAIDGYYSCPFSFYLSNILNINIYEDTFDSKLGTLFHSILEKYKTFNGTYDELWNQELNNSKLTFDTKEQFFLDNLKPSLELVIKTLKEYDSYTELDKEYHEERIIKEFDGDIKVKFKGFIDKIKYKKEDDKTIIAIIDYKTGKVKIDLTTMPDGIGMQLPIYLYLASQCDKIENPVVAGFYIQHILPDGLTKSSDDEEYEDQVKEYFMLNGYSNSDESILAKLDRNYKDSKMIIGIKFNGDGSFHAKSKVLTTEQIDKIKNLAEEKIIESAKRITSADFTISPKVKGKTNYGCGYCKYRDICFRTPDDLEELPKRTLKDIIGGEE